MTDSSSAAKVVDALRKALRDNEQLKKRNQQLEQHGRDPIAIVGMGCRLPGGADSPEKLWDLLADGGDAVTSFPDRPGWELDSLVDRDAERSGTTYVSRGGFLHDADLFDAGFFGISPREAVAMDPQQRLLLEVAWETLEHARISPASLRGTATGVFAAATGQDYGPMVSRSGMETDGFLATGSAGSIASGRISYTLGLEGPAVTLDTGCSSTLVALHLAVKSLRSGECSLALAGGATLMASPATFSEFSAQKGLAPDGRCKPFSDDADGTAWGEGVGMLLVERLSDARRNGHRVLAVVRGTAVNQDGASNGLTAPNGVSQQRVIREALGNAGLTPADVDLVEAHGTGTTLGDPIEAEALLAAYGQDRPEGRPLWVGSVKSNLAHTQGAAGAAGIIKSILAMRHGVMPKSLHVGTPSTHVDWSAGAVELLAEERVWTREDDRPRRAGVSSFGMSGTNAHVILEEPPAETPADEPGDIPAALPWLVSARSAAGLRGQAAALVPLAGGDLDRAAVGWSLLSTRAVLEHRAVVTGDFGAGLAALAGGEPADNVVAGVSGPVGRTAFVFPGQGAQWVGMGAALLDASPVFAGSVAACEAAMSGYVDWSLAAVLRGEEGAPSLERVDVVQPASFAVMVSVAALWRSFGVEPQAVIGHSQGEIAAACVAGILSLEDAARVVCLRSRAIAEVAGSGGMASVAVSVERAEELIARFEGRVSVAAVNGPSQVVVSGEAAALDELGAVCEREEVRFRRVAVDYASHSVAMEELRETLATALAGVTPQAGSVPLMSTVSAELVDPLSMDAGYWFTNLRQRVRFSEGVAKLASEGFGVFAEMSSHPVMTSAVEATVDAMGGEPVVVTGSLRREDGGLDRFLAGLAAIWVRGAHVDWSVAFGDTPPPTVDLPTYAFQRQSYWPTFATREDVSGSEGGGSVVDAEFWAAVQRGDAAALATALDTDTSVLDPLMPALAGWHRQQQEQNTTDGWRYEVKWRPRGRIDAAPALSGTWLVALPAVVADSAHAVAVTDALAAHGADVHTLTLPDEEAADREVLASRLRDVPELVGVLCLSALDERPHPVSPATATGLAGLLALVQALGDADVDAPLWIATSGAVGIGPSDPQRSRVQAAVWGFGRVVGLEHPERWGGLVDLPARLDGRGAERLAALLADGGEDQIALRDSGAFVRRLVHARPAARGTSRTWQPHGTVLVTGGTGGIGSAAARWLAHQGVDHLVLTGRRGAEAPGAAELQAELAELGVGVTLVACDVADRDALAGALDAVPDAHPLTAVLHAAGVGQFQQLADTGLSDLSDVLRAKVLGALHLDDLLGDRDLDAFVLFSSNAGVWGSGGQAAYAAANAFLDAFAEDRRLRGRTATSVAWGAWGETGMAADAGMAQHLQARGILSMEPELALAALRGAVERDETCAVVADMDWARFAKGFTAARPRPLLNELPAVQLAQEPEHGPAGAADEDGGVLRSRLGGRSPAEQLRELVGLVRTHAAAVLGHADAGGIEDGRAFRELGFDSLTAVELRNRLSSVTGLRLPATLVFDHAQPRRLAAHLRDELFGGDASEDVVAGQVSAADEPLAIVGMSCRFPGDVRSPDDLWRLLERGGDALSPLPADRGWPTAVGGVREGGFVDDASGFDAAFFGMSPREALATDPQQRLLLEASWEALEHAGINPASLRSTPTGVFVGCNNMGYGGGPDIPEDVQGHLLIGNATSVVSGRVAYTLGLEGPAVTLDTACSSSLVALHWAARSLNSGESSMALVGGVAVMATPGSFTEFGRQGGLAGDGRCKAFSDDADGTGWGEGVGILVLERLSDARRNGHRVLAVVKGSAINQDGASNGLASPSGPAQQRVIRQALANAGVTAAEVDLVEAHGTGTSLGDPIEAHALLATYGQDREDGRPAWLGSVKSNLAHTQAAAGVAGVIKAVLALRHGVMPKTLYADTPSSQVDWSAGAVELLTEPRQWAPTGRPRRAGVSSFGISGTNAHVIVEEAPAETGDGAPAAPPTGGSVELPLIPLPVSAKTPTALARQGERLLAAVPDRPPLDVALSLATTRAGLDRRAVVLGADAAGIRSGLGALAAGETSPAVVSDRTRAGLTAFVFSGQGGQRAGMGRELAAAFPVFEAALDEVCAHFDGLLDRPLREVMFEDPDGLLRQTGWAQPALFAVEVALFRLAESWGLEPDYLAGHSVGELAAAHAAGVLSLTDACTLVAARASLMQALPEGGAMWAVRATPEEVEPHLVEGVSIAVVNAPGQVVVSGAREAVEQVAGALGEGRQSRWLEVSHAFHSPLMDPMLADFARAAAEIDHRRPRLPVVSTLTGEPVEEFTADYWVDQLRGTVRFADAAARLADEGVIRFLELGPDAALVGAVEETCADGILAVPLLRRDKPEPHTAITALARLWAHGGDPDWSAFFAPTGARVTDLPTYPFEHQPYWLKGWAWQGPDPADGWRYRVDWQPVTAASGTGPAGRLLVLSQGDDPGARALADALTAHGAQPVPVTLDPAASREALTALLAAHTGVDGVLFLSGPTRSGGPDTAPVEAAADVVRALGDAGITAPLWCVTCGAVATTRTDAPPRPELAAVWGLGRVAGLEHPDRWGGLADLPADPTPQDLDRLLAFVASGGEDQIAVRADGVYARRLVRGDAPAQAEADTPLALSGTVLLTGGTGALGAHVARWAAEHGTEHLVLLSRRGPDAPGAGALREELEAAGARVTLAACDAADRAALTALLDRLDGDGVTVDAVVHAAGVVEDALLHTMTADQLAAMWSAKATAARHLDELFTGRDLSAFVLFSSLAGLLGSVGQAGYAAANAYLDALAERRAADGLPALSVAWGPWAGDGMAADVSGEAMRHSGLVPMAPEPALAALGRALTGQDAHTAVADADWNRVAAGRGAAGRAPLLNALLDPADAADGDAATAPEEIAALRREVRALAPAARHSAVLEAVRTEAAAALGHPSIEPVQPDAPLSDLGFDSLLALDLRGRLIALTGLALPATLAFDHPTAEALAGHLLDEMCGTDPAEETAQITVPRPADDEPLAVVSMSCRFAGGLETPEDLWRLLADGADAIRAFPEDRGWDTASLYHPDPDHPGTSYTREGGFLQGVAEFDAELFGINPREALAMDPQQRLLMECSWEAFERAGIDPRSVRGSQVGVFAGTNGQDYPAALHESDENVAGYLATGSSASVFSGRVAYAFGLEGPAVTVDTACSASLVALHLAAQALRSGECDAALVGGASVMSTPGAFLEFSRQRALSPDGRCKAFSDDADGTGWGEGAGVVLVERLSDARRKGHPVLAVLRGSAVNQDGASNGLTAPNGAAQQRVIRKALAAAGLGTGDVDAVEAHGTGTTLGDPIEAQALLATYGRDRAPDRPLWLGSVKSNLGHTQAAAGLAGVIKMVLALRHGTLPRTLHVSAPSSHVDWGDGTVRLLTEQQTWPAYGRPRRAAVSAFGVSGTNAHVVLEEAPAPEPVAAPAEEPVAPEGSATAGVAPAVVPWTVSGATPEALAAQADRLLSAATARAGHWDVADVARSLAAGRAALDRRAVVVGAGHDELAAGLAALAAGREAPQVLTGTAGAPGRTVFVFPGQGAQWVGMATELADASPVFAAKLADCEAALGEFTDWSLSEVLRGEPGAPTLDRVDVVQPALFAVMVSLAALWRSSGVHPHAVVGHSQGEIAAACVAGALSLRDAARIVCLRSQALTALAGEGGMASLMLAEEPARALLAGYEGRLFVAAVNGPGSVVVSGEADALDRLQGDCAEREIRIRRIPVDYASHSAHVDRIREELATALAPTVARRPETPMLSTVTGTWIEEGDVDADYWFRNLRQPVLLHPAVRDLADQGHRTYLEMSPHPVLTVPVQETLDALAVTAGRVFVGGSLRREEGSLRRFTISLAEAYVTGVDVDWTAVLGGVRSTPVDLPTYAFQRRTFWPGAATATADPAGGADPVDGAFWKDVEGENTEGLADALGLAPDALTDVLPALARWRRTRRDAASLDAWRYRIAWRPLTGRRPQQLAGTWLLLAPASCDPAWRDAVARALDVPGVDVRPVDVDAATATRDALAALLRQHAPQDGPARGVLSLLGLHEEPHPAHPAVPGGLAATLLLAQAAADLGLRTPLWHATRNAVTATEADRLDGTAQGQLWGLGRVLGLEDVDRWGGLVDLPTDLDEQAAGRLRHVLADTGGEDQVAVRRGGVHARRLVHAPLGDLPARRDWKTGGTALVTGGTGGIGAHVARWLAGAGAEHLVLTSRRGADAPGAGALRDDLTALGVRVTVAACDVADRDAVAALLAGLREDGETLRTVVHAAGVVQATAMPEMTLSEFQQVAAAKALGAAHLDELLGDAQLDAFVLFSSNAGVWGSGGQGAYAAANASLDALAQHRRQRGLTATSVAWGAWGGGGMAADPGAEEHLRRRGVLTMRPERALAALTKALEHDETALAVADVDWERFAPSFTAARPRPLLDELPAVRRALRADGPDGPVGETADAGTGQAERLRAMPAAERDAALFDLVRDAVAAVLGHDGGRAVDAGRAFKDLGFDSLTSVELRNRLTAATGLQLPATLVFDHPTPLDLTTLLCGEFAGEGQEEESPEQVVMQGLDKIEAEISALSPDHDLDALQERLRSLISRVGDRQSVDTDVPVTRQLETASDDELFDFIHREFGK
ncbi:SDR family NAD(P)-dependent oxidoreductase [Streptomyces sp. RKND-216]|uniref:type I polyketide synthase n=1 Tax=Streptomyces sp. RKND-216 TaxID=2562581 RepID=UPI00109D9EF0|nr:type I polyketide synthase [Streptomyces sp. RKND-216]THA26353.1 SDR family NAD(P)-dependent oxidoreductase [Streptomyces sp. RKND-216]